MEPAYKLLTVEEFLDAPPPGERHYQLIDGVIVAMAPPGGRHQIIAGNLTFEMVAMVRANLPNCTVRSQGGIAPQGVKGRDHFETDITVTCERRDGYKGIIEEPLLIVEILSPGTERDDVFVKLPAYRRIAGLEEILYVETDRLGAMVYRRDGKGWREIELAGPEARLELDTVGLDIPLASLYRGTGLAD